ncbi:GP46-like surface antigen, putative [Bodo saltans]|uniref:GP46-like surface antigen, putative n=1 Tax=Bodo saltans TaxID=75058 RepID=A0A0S4JGL5_BODSA|nr:GP46-like surface antigen, putative [Bodo saltans]|eukprot:CUG88585.1 GP46-like surface antigen, putative [Bodo saltans]
MMSCILTCTCVTILLMVTTAQSSCLCAFRLPELQVFYDAMSGPQWKSRWDFSDPDAPCVFAGVNCDIGSVDITAISLARDGLSGQLPAAVANLSKLSRFNVSFNSITGTLPPEYARWVFISQFLVDSNNITGTLPPEYSAWGMSMKRFYCGRNTISGTLPKNYSSWIAINEFDVQYNQLEGSLPPEFSAWRPSSFTLGYNLISSTLPVEYSEWGDAIHYFYLQECDIYGSLPPSYSSWVNLSAFALKNSRINGTLPPQYGALVGIGTFVISSSFLSGVIPSNYSAWRGVTTFDLSNNRLIGTIPSGMWGSMTSLNAVALWNNSLSGTIPPQLLQVPTLGYLSIGFNQFTGTISKVTSSLLFLIVQNNPNLAGSIPSSSALVRIVSICGTSIQCPTSNMQLYCFPREMIYEFALTDVASALIKMMPFQTTCTTPQPPPVSLLSTTRTPFRDAAQPTPFDTFIPAHTAPQTLVAIASIVDPISGVALVALGNSRCAPQSLRSSTSTSQLVLSPFYPLGPGASVLGNIGLVLVVVVLHALSLRLYVAFGQNWHQWRARMSLRGNRSPTCRHRGSRSPPPPPPETTLKRRAAASVLRFPNISIVIALHFARGTVFYGAQEFVGTDDHNNGGGDGSDSIAMRAGSATASVLFLIGLVVCFVYAEGSGLTEPLVFQKYQLAVLRRWKWMPLWALPVGQWGPAEARHRLGPLRGSVTRGRERFAMLTAGVGVASSLLIGAVPSSASGCVAQAIGQCVLLSAAAVVVAVMRPLRISLSSWLLCVTWAVQGCLNFSMAASRVWDSEEAVSASSIFTIVHVVLGLITTIHRCVIMYWERGVKPKTAFLTPNEVVHLNSTMVPITISPVRLPSQHRQRGRRFAPLTYQAMAASRMVRPSRS